MHGHGQWHALLRRKETCLELRRRRAEERHRDGCVELEVGGGGVGVKRQILENGSSSPFYAENLHMFSPEKVPGIRVYR